MEHWTQNSTVNGALDAKFNSEWNTGYKFNCEWNTGYKIEQWMEHWIQNTVKMWVPFLPEWKQWQPTSHQTMDRNYRWKIDRGS